MIWGYVLFFLGFPPDMVSGNDRTAFSTAFLDHCWISRLNLDQQAMHMG